MSLSDCIVACNEVISGWLFGRLARMVQVNRVATLDGTELFTIINNTIIGSVHICLHR